MHTCSSAHAVMTLSYTPYLVPTFILSTLYHVHYMPSFSDDRDHILWTEMTKLKMDNIKHLFLWKPCAKFSAY